MTSAPFSTPSPDQPTARPQLRRSGTEKMLGGVCGGIARYLGVDPVAVRVGYAILSFISGGLGILAYFVLWLLMPEE